jgi:hypothetical protein
MRLVGFRPDFLRAKKTDSQVGSCSCLRLIFRIGVCDGLKPPGSTCVNAGDNVMRDSKYPA